MVSLKKICEEGCNGPQAPNCADSREMKGWDGQHVCGGEKNLIPLKNGPQCRQKHDLHTCKDLQVQCRRADSMNIVVALARSIWETISPVL